MSLLSKAACLGGISGCILVSAGMPLGANLIWSVANMMMIIYAHSINEKDIRNMYVIYEIIAIIGIINLTR